MKMNAISEKPMRVFTRDTVVTFGKHKGLKVSTILENDPGYIVWMNDNIDDICFVEGIVREAEDSDLEDSRDKYDDSWGWDGDVQD